MIVLCTTFWHIATTNFTKRKINITMTTPIPETAQARHNPDPYNTQVPVIGQADHEPFPTPLGVVPHFKTPNQNWTWDYGAGP
jgi:hypothetical protein